MQVPQDCLINIYQCFGGDIGYAFLTFASILYNLTPVRAFGKTIEEKRSNHTKTKLAEAVGNCEVFKCGCLTTINNGMLSITMQMVSVLAKHLMNIIFAVLTA